VEGPSHTSTDGAEPGGRGAALHGGDARRDGGTLTRDRPTSPTKIKPPKRKLRRSTKIALAVIAVVALIEAAAFSGTYFLYSRHYVSTDNAQVDGDQLAIIAPATGTLTRWTIDKGSAIRPNEIVGRIEHLGSAVQPQRPIKSPGQGIVAVSSAVNGQYVTQGTQLAVAYGPEGIYVTARVDEADVRFVHVGALVDISVDGYPNATVTGMVLQIQNSAAGNFTIYPPAGTDPTNPQRVDQYIPVRIAFLDTGGEVMRPGMNVTVHIHKP
jgi:multidrug resistance efflux pump